jgi:predicted transcriptional regulator
MSMKRSEGGRSGVKPATRGDLLHMTADVVSAYVGNNAVEKADISDVIGTVYRKFSALSDPPPRTPSARPSAREAAVPIKRSVTPDYLVCLEDGKKLKLLKRHLRTAYGMTPEQYRAKWGLPPDYPMVAPNYAARRSQFAKDIGLGKVTGRGGRG